jgi:GNAT acetyltransferase-like protein
MTPFPTLKGGRLLLRQFRQSDSKRGRQPAGVKEVAFSTEAVKAALACGFMTLNLHRLNAPHFRDNPASGRVLLVTGMT